MLFLKSPGIKIESEHPSTDGSKAQDRNEIEVKQEQSKKESEKQYLKAQKEVNLSSTTEKQDEFHPLSAGPLKEHEKVQCNDDPEQYGLLFIYLGDITLAILMHKEVFRNKEYRSGMIFKIRNFCAYLFMLFEQLS